MVDPAYSITCAKCMRVFTNFVIPGNFATNRTQAEAIARKYGARNDKNGSLICAKCVDAAAMAALLDDSSSLCNRCAIPKKEGEVWSTFHGYEICAQCNRDLTSKLRTFEGEDPTDWAPLMRIKTVIKNSKTVISDSTIKGPRRKIELD